MGGSTTATQHIFIALRASSSRLQGFASAGTQRCHTSSRRSNHLVSAEARYSERNERAVKAINQQIEQL